MVEKKKKSVRAEDFEKERIGILEFAKKIGKNFSGLTIASGVMLILFSVYLMITHPFPNLVDTKLFLFMMLAFLGVLNAISGLLLMGRTY